MRYVQLNYVSVSQMTTNMFRLS